MSDNGRIMPIEVPEAVEERMREVADRFHFLKKMREMAVIIVWLPFSSGEALVGSFLIALVLVAVWIVIGFWAGVGLALQLAVVLPVLFVEIIRLRLLKDWRAEDAARTWRLVQKFNQGLPTIKAKIRWLRGTAIRDKVDRALRMEQELRRMRASLEREVALLEELYEAAPGLVRESPGLLTLETMIQVEGVQEDRMHSLDDVERALGQMAAYRELGRELNGN